jgi:hypothetical protein
VDVIDGADLVAARDVRLVAVSVTKMIGTSWVAGRWRMSWAVSKPSMPGMFTSSRMTANSWFSRQRSASRPE